MDRLVKLGDFLRSRRARLQPVEGETAAQGRRRVPGLRREELARLAGVSVEYYTRLEQGRSKNASATVLDAIARALRLNETERDHLFALASPILHPVRDHPGSRQQVPPATYELLDTLEHAGVPACVLSRCLDVLIANRPYRALLMWSDDRPVRDRNLARFCFLDPSARELYSDWEHVAADLTAVLRFALGRHPGEPKLNELIEELLGDEEFRRVWAAHHVHERTSGRKGFHHPIVGDMSVTYQFLRLPEESEQFLCVCTATRGSPSASALDLLVKWAMSGYPPHNDQK
ncbi:helix-turn-helix transcriptional regulator [Planotetraspora kaengkrachanensis]|uniref:Transcriptional regulator n=1 Tax=Planotetraspora kaengkrachanensis TaxID=575193 RepID=A0A8J3PUK3_9ACTN|nr:helix-turn-helix transcriptional regulator [Planotetraspora kaengkrachanensis]GIG81332.1 transcriptional regulator [Planotetraspora kaengkrachanensis]